MEITAKVVYYMPMISHLSGTLLLANDRFIVLDVQGVGYKVRVSLDTLHAIKNTATNAQKISLWTHLVVREDILDLYGFLNENELDFFELLISVSGIGPRSALGILNVAPIEHLKEAIGKGDVSSLTKVSGIGSKSAQKIVLELKDKVGFIITDKYSNVLHDENDAIEGLQALGYSGKEAREALKQTPPEIAGTGNRIKYALKYLSK